MVKKKYGRKYYLLIGFLLLCMVGSFWMQGLRAEAATGKQEIAISSGAKTPHVQTKVPANISLNKTAVSMLVGKTQQFTLKNATGKVTWSSSKPSVITVSQTGKLKAKSNGKCIVTAKYRKKTYRCTVTVYSSHKTQRTALLQKKYTKAKDQGKIVLAGSSMFELWPDFASAFAPYETINVGIRGTTVDDWLQLYPKLIVKYKPKAVVLYVGGNNIQKNEANLGKITSAKQQKLLKKLREALPGVPIYFVSIHPNWKRWSAWEQTQICNNLTKQFCAKQKKTYFIDITQYCLTKKGVPNKALLRDDMLHLNSKGYTKVWKNHVAVRVKRDLRAMGK